MGCRGLDCSVDLFFFWSELTVCPQRDRLAWSKTTFAGLGAHVSYPISEKNSSHSATKQR